MNPLKAIDDFLRACEEYLDTRVKTGAFVKDIKTLHGETGELAKKKEHIYAHRFVKSKFTKNILAIFTPIWNAFMLLPFTKDGFGIFVDSLILLRKSYVQQFIIYSATLLSYIILYNLFINSPIVFFIWLLPILLYNLMCFSSLSISTQKHTKGEKASLISAFLTSLRNPTLYTLFFNHVFGALLITTAFFIFASSLSYIYDFLRVDWTNNFFYWYLATFLLFLAIFVLFVFNIVSYQSYLFAALENNNFSTSLTKAWDFVRKNYGKFLFFCFVFAGIFAFIIYRENSNNFPSGFLISLFSFSYGTVLLHVLLRKRFLSEVPNATVTTMRNTSLFIIIFFLGSVTFVLSAALAVQHYPNIINFIKTTQENTYIKQQLTSYTNQENGYVISYPKTWSLYEDNANAITFYNNATGTRIGGIWLIITISPFKEAEFDKLYKTRPGLIAYDTLEKTVTSKIYDYKQQGYDAIKYTYFKSQPQDDVNAIPITIYETRYLIHKEDKQYEITLRTLDKNVEGNNVNLFEAIAKSFKFLNQ